MGGYIMQLQNYSVNDGEGIRTNVFLAGCPPLSMVFESGGTDDQEPYDQIYGDRGDY